MALWLVRAGKYGEFEPRFFGDNRIYLGWEELAIDLTPFRAYEEMKTIVAETYPDASPGRLSIHAGEIWAFVSTMQVGDWVATPLKSKPAIAIGEITGGYAYDQNELPLFRHSRRVRWLNTEVPRSAFDQDLLYSLGSSLTICTIRRNEAEARIRAMAATNWESSATKAKSNSAAPERIGGETSDEMVDLERLGRDQIQKLLIRKLKGHGMERLVAAILDAQGYTTLVSAPGADGGTDILAAPGELGFGHPRICVQVKSEQNPVKRDVLDQLMGTMQRVGADQGLLVAWGGFKGSITKEHQFFRVRLWDADDLVDQLLQQYARLPEDLRAEIPLKRIWAVAFSEDV